MARKATFIVTLATDNGITTIKTTKLQMAIQNGKHQRPLDITADGKLEIHSQGELIASLPWEE